nr:DnaD domain protein [uncultured Oscillibacter sp.]
MPSVLVHAPDEPVILASQAVKRLLDRGDGDAALLYLALLRRRGDAPPRSLAGELRWDRGRIEAAEAALRDLGLITPQAPPAEPADEPPAYRQDELAGKLEESEDFRRLTAEVERKLGKRLTTADLSALLGLYDYLGLPSDVIYLLVCHCAERAAGRFGPGRRPTLRQIEREGYAWARRGIDTQAAAAEYLRDYGRRQGALPGFMRALRLGDRPPAASEEHYLLQWLEWGFSPEAAALAYDKTVLKCHEFKWSYCNGILRRWHEAGLHTVDEIEAGDRRSRPPAASGVQPSPGRAGGNAWMRKYIQRREKEG